MKPDGYTAQRTLGFVNRTRKEFGLKPLERIPKGLPGSFTQCPVARALTNGSKLEATVHQATVAVSDYGARSLVIASPRYVLEFISAFDYGRIPELIDR